MTRPTPAEIEEAVKVADRWKDAYDSNEQSYAAMVGQLARALLAVVAERNGLSVAGQVLTQALTDEATGPDEHSTRLVDGDDVLAMVDEYRRTVDRWRKGASDADE